MFRFDRGELSLRRYGSEGVHATRIAAGDGPLNLTCLDIGPDGLLGTHPASAAQLFLVVSGEGWVAGPDGRRVPITAGWGVRWEAGEEHTSGTKAGLTAIAAEGASLSLFGPDAPGA